MKILLVEDDESIAEALERVLIKEHYAVDIASDGQMGWQLVETFDYNLILLDVILPKLNGIDFCRKLREHRYQTPVLLITAQNSSTQRIMGLDAGADDYIVKPFEIDEFLARIRVLLRRANSPVLTTIQYENLRLNPGTRDVTYKGCPLAFTPKEYRLLELFLRKQHYVFSRNVILESLWTCDEAPSEDAVTAHIKGLRQKLKQAGAPADLIETVYGIGYRLKPIDINKPLAGENSGAPLVESCNSTELRNDGVAASAGPSEILSPPTLQSLAQPENSQPQLRTDLTRVWQKFRNQYCDRLVLLQQTASAVLEDRLNENLRQSAQLAAHKLAGALGVFGLPEGSQLAREIEQWLKIEPLTAQSGNPSNNHSGNHSGNQSGNPSNNCSGNPSDHQSGNHSDKQQFVELVTLLEQVLYQALVLPHQPLPYHTCSLLVLVDDHDLMQQLIQMARAQGLQIRLAADLESVRIVQTETVWTNWLQMGGNFNSPQTSTQTRAERHPLDIVLLNFALDTATANNLASLIDLVNQPPPVPVVVCTNNDSLANRVKAAQLGTSMFLYQPDVHQVLQVMTMMHARIGKKSARVLAVDDDPEILSTLQTLLEPWELNLTTLEQPLQLWQMLKTSPPDLLLLDVEMSYFNGIDLCRVVRQTLPWNELPIVFLTVHNDINIERQAFAAGANDVIHKSVSSSELVTRIMKQLGRSQLQRTMSTLIASKP